MTLPKCNLQRSWVQGYVLEFDQPEILNVLDELEGCNPDFGEHLNDYLRCQIPALNPVTQSQEFVWTYVMTDKKITEHGGITIPEGCWRSGQQYF